MTTTAPPRTHTPPSLRVVHAVADTLDVDPRELSPPLGAVLDTDALDRLGQCDATTTFEYAGCLVTLTADDEVVVQTEDSL